MLLGRLHGLQPGRDGGKGLFRRCRDARTRHRAGRTVRCHGHAGMAAVVGRHGLCRDGLTALRAGSQETGEKRCQEHDGEQSRHMAHKGLRPSLRPKFRLIAPVGPRHIRQFLTVLLHNDGVSCPRQSLAWRFLALWMAVLMLLAGCSVSPIPFPDRDSSSPVAAADAAADPCHAPESDCRKAHQCNPALAASRNAIATAPACVPPVSAQSFCAEFANPPTSPPPLSAST